MEKTLITRAEVDKNLTWDLSAIFKTEEDFNQAVQKAMDLTAETEAKYKGKLTNALNINECLDGLRSLYEILFLAGNYASLNASTDQSNMKNVERQIKFGNVSANLFSSLSFIESEILECDEKIIDEAIAQNRENAHFLTDLKEDKAHTLHKEAERVLSALSSTLDLPHTVYNQTKLVDMDFKPFTADGKEYPLSFGLFENEWEYENNTEVRRAAFKAFSEKLREYQHTIATAYQGQVQKEKTLATLRGFDSVFDSLLYSQKVTRAMYDRQIDVITERLAPHMRKYAKLLQRIHKLDKMTFADLKLDVDHDFEPEITVPESKAYITGALSVLGDDYTEMLERAYKERWVDFVQNKGKSTGAFCSSPYGAHPFVLISWTYRMRETFVLSHELGHAGHFYLAQKHQNIFNTRPSQYFIEAPSTMNEMLMANYLMKKNTDKRFKRWVLSSIVSRTYYHNFVTHLLEAAYQREVYQIIDAGGSVNAPKLNQIKRSVLEKFWGDAVEINEGAELTWMRQPHYYMGLYPYTYSAGLTVATEVSKRILSGDKEAVAQWREVLKAGGTLNPVELSALAGVDITTDQPLIHTIEHIGNMIDEIIQLTDELEQE